MSQHANQDDLVISEDPLHVNYPAVRLLNLAFETNPFFAMRWGALCRKSPQTSFLSFAVAFITWVG